MAKEKNSFQANMRVRVTDDAFKCPKKRGQVVGRTGFSESFLQDGNIRVVGTHKDGQIYVMHPEVVGTKRAPVKICPKFFEQITS